MGIGRGGRGGVAVLSPGQYLKDNILFIIDIDLIVSGRQAVLVGGYIPLNPLAERVVFESNDIGIGVAGYLSCDAREPVVVVIGIALGI